MQERHYKTILYFISAVIICTLAVQIYWNYKNYEVGKAQLKRDMQISIDNAVSAYYEGITASNTIGFLGDDQNLDLFFKSDKMQNLGKRVDSGLTINSIKIEQTNNDDNIIVEGASPTELDSIFASRVVKVDTTYAQEFKRNSPTSSSHTTFKVFGESEKAVEVLSKRIKNNLRTAQQETDSSQKALPDRLEALTDLTTSIVLSFKDDKINVPSLDSLINLELTRKNLNNTQYTIAYNTAESDTTQTLNNHDLAIVSTSNLLPKKSSLAVGFKNVASIVLQRNLLGMLLSLLLVGAVIASLLYLLKIIQEQKQLAEIKNDFISNITHEFKTPIATIGVAIESIQHFNEADSKEKTKKYLEMSSQQVSKLNTMVEKLLETATLDSEALELNKQEANLAELLEHITQSHQETTNGKTLTFTTQDRNISASIDVFHLENALDNIIDNAIKYGGDTIKIALNSTKETLQITIADGGNKLTKQQAQHIFDKFYRVPKGNKHDVKGFGIGLYYTKTIIEKHSGNITVQTQPTTFKITLPYV